MTHRGRAAAASRCVATMRLRRRFVLAGMASVLVAIAALAACDSNGALPVGDGGPDAPRAPRPIYEDSGPWDEDPDKPCNAVQPDADLSVRVPSPYAGKTNPLPSSVSDGQALYVAECKRCHGAEGRGGGDLTPPAADLTSHAHADDYIFWRIARGGSGDPVCSQMPAFETQLSEEERWQLVAFVRSIEPDAGLSDAAGQ